MKQLAILFSVYFVFCSSPSYGASKLSLQAKTTTIIITTAYDKCLLIFKQGIADYRLGAMDSFAKGQTALTQCQRSAPDSIKARVKELRAALKAAGKSEALLKDMVLTFRQGIERIGETDNPIADGEKFGNLIRSKGDRIVAELDW